MSGAAPSDLPDLVPARMVNAFAYCPRLAWLEWVASEFQDNADTVEGRWRHRRVDEERGAITAPDPAAGASGGGDDAGRGGSRSGPGQAGDRREDGASAVVPPAGDAVHARSVLLSSEADGLIARIDLVEGTGLDVTPVEYKRGRRPDIPEGAWEPDRVQVCVQAMVLRANGFRVTHGEVYYLESRERVRFAVDAAIEERTRSLVGEMRRMAEAGREPPPLVDSPKCVRCSLAPICLPDETRYLAAAGVSTWDPPDDGVSDGPTATASARDRAGDGAPDGGGTSGAPRRLFPARDDALPLYVLEQGATVGRRDEALVVRAGTETLAEVRLLDVSQVSLFGAVQVTTQAVQAMFQREIPLCWFSRGGWFYGHAQGLGLRNAEWKRHQFAAAADPARALALARRVVAAKVRNARTLLRRNHPEPPEEALARLRALAGEARRAPSTESLLGVEGSAARVYFAHFASMLRPPSGGDATFAFDGRNRRPPRDPVNALLSLAYALLAKDATVALLAVGLDPFVGFYHRPRFGRPALALDLMEEFRPLVAESVVLGVVNTGEIRASDFLRRAGAVALGPSGRKRFLGAYERRMDELVTHPVFGYRISYRRVLEVQSRLLARHLAGEIPEFPAFVTR